MQRRDAAKPLHLENRKVAHSDGADLALLQECVHCVSSLFDQNQRIRPVNLIDVDVIGSKPAQGVLDLAQDAGAAGIAEYPPVIPFQSGLGGNKDLSAQPAFGDCLADDLLRTAESLNRGGIDNVDAMLESGADGRE